MAADEHGARQRLIDKDAIIDVVHGYSYGVDHRRYDDVVALFTVDCVVDFGPGAPPVRGRAALRTMFGYSIGGFVATSHHNANVLVSFENDDRARVRASLYAGHELADGTTPQLWGYYHDVVVRTSEGWQIASRQLRVLGLENWASLDREWHWSLRSPEA